MSLNGRLPPPVYITMGPPCSGKTTWLRETGGAIDVAIDDQPGVYRPIPLSDFVNVPNTTEYQEVVANQTLRARVLANVELRSILCLLRGDTTVEELSSALQPLVPAAVLTLLLETVAQFPSPQLPSHIDMFIRERLFQGTANSPSAIRATDIALEKALTSNRPVALGNTNTRPKEYQTTLAAASRARRPVVFVVHRPTNCTWPTDCFDLEADLPELLRRNIGRLLATGRYIPASVMLDMCQRTAASLEMIRGDQPPPTTKFAFHQMLARAAGFDMRDDRTIVPLKRPQAESLRNHDARGHRRPYQQGPRQHWDNQRSSNTSGQWRQDDGYQRHSGESADGYDSRRESPRRDNPQAFYSYGRGEVGRGRELQWDGRSNYYR